MHRCENCGGNSQSINRACTIMTFKTWQDNSMRRKSSCGRLVRSRDGRELPQRCKSASPQVFYQQAVKVFRIPSRGWSHHGSESRKLWSYCCQYCASSTLAVRYSLAHICTERDPLWGRTTSIQSDAEEHHECTICILRYA